MIRISLRWLLPVGILCLLVADSAIVWSRTSTAMDTMANSLARDTRHAVLHNVISDWTRALEKYFIYLDECVIAHTNSFVPFQEVKTLKNLTVKVVRNNTVLSKIRGYLLQLMIRASPQAVPYVSLALQDTKTYVALEFDPANSTHMIFWVRRKNELHVGWHVNITSNELDGNIVELKTGNQSTYDPTTRSWYVIAKSNPFVFRFSDVYIRSTGRDLQTSPSIFLPGFGVFSIHATTTALSLSLSKSKPSASCVLHVVETQSGLVVGSTRGDPVVTVAKKNPNTSFVEYSSFRQSLDTIEDGGPVQEIRTLVALTNNSASEVFDSDGSSSWLISSILFDKDWGFRWTTILLIPTAEVMGAKVAAQADVLVTTLLVCLGSLMLSTPAVIFMAFQVSILVRAFHHVAEMRLEHESIETASNLKTVIAELHDLQSAFVIMTSKLLSFRAFLPSHLYEENEEEEDAWIQDVLSDEQMEDHNGKQYEVILKSSSSCNETVSDQQTHTLQSGTQSSIAHRPQQTTQNHKKLSCSLEQKSIAVISLNVRGTNQVLGTNPSETDVQSFLSWHERVVEHVQSGSKQFKGIIDGFHGDRFFIHFNAVVGCPQFSVSACRAALHLDSTFRQNMQTTVSMGISACTAFVGNLGPTTFRRFSILSSGVHQATILERWTRMVEIQQQQQTPTTIVVNGRIMQDGEHEFKFTALDVLPHPYDGTKKHQPNVLVLALTGTKNAEDDEWMYQLEGTMVSDPNHLWNRFLYEISRGRVTEAQTIVREMEDKNSTQYPRAKRVLSMSLQGHPCTHGEEYFLRAVCGYTGQSLPAAIELARMPHDLTDKHNALSTEGVQRPNSLVNVTTFG